MLLCRDAVRASNFELLIEVGWCPDRMGLKGSRSVAIDLHPLAIEVYTSASHKRWVDCLAGFLRF